MKILFLRISADEVSREEIKEFDSLDDYLNHKWNQQEKAIKEKFKINKFDVVIKDHGTAFKQKKISLRAEYQKLLKILFNYDKTTIKDIFEKKLQQEPKELYVFDFNRLSRLFEYNLLTYLLSDLFNVTIFSYRQDYILKREDEKVIEKFTRYITASISAFSSEDYVRNTSDNVKKAVNRIDGKVTFSDKDKKWGKSFSDSKGKKIKLTSKQNIKLVDYIIRLVKQYEKFNFSSYYQMIIDKVEAKFGIVISKSYITTLRKRMN